MGNLLMLLKSQAQVSSFLPDYMSQWVADVRACNQFGYIGINMYHAVRSRAHIDCRTRAALISQATVQGREAKMIFKSVIVRSAVCAAIVCAAISANSANASVINFTLTQGAKTDSWSIDASSVPYINQNPNGINYDTYYSDNYSHVISAFPAGVNFFMSAGPNSQTGNVPWFDMQGNYEYIADFSTDRPFVQTPGSQSFISGIYQLTQYGPNYFGGSGPATLTISVGLAPTAPAPLAGSGALSAFAALAAFGMTRLRKRKAFAA